MGGRRASQVMTSMRELWCLTPQTVSAKCLDWRAIVLCFGCPEGAYYELDRHVWSARVRRWADDPPVMKNIQTWNWNELDRRITPAYLAERSWNAKVPTWLPDAKVLARVKAWERMIEARRRVELAAGNA